MAKRFIVVDPSFTAHDGDRWQYSINLARSAREMGFEFVLLTNEKAPKIGKVLDFSIDQRCIFPFSFYQHDKVYERHRKVVQSDRLKRLNQLWCERTARLERRRDWLRDRGDHLGARSAERKLARHARRTMWQERVERFFGGASRARPFNRDDFALALAKALRGLKPGPDDILFFHTMTYGMMESLSEVTAALGYREPFDTSAYFLFHFGADASDARTYLDRYHSYSAYGSIAERMRVGSPFARLHYLATSEILCEEAARILGAPVDMWHGLADLHHFEESLGGCEAIIRRRQAAMKALCEGEIRVLVRAADLDWGKAIAVSRACHLAQHRGNVVRLRILYHQGSIDRLRDLVTHIDFPNVELVNADSNATYIGEVCDAGIALLTYDQDKYAKRVSAVLHDCAVLGVPCLVPEQTTLADCDYATLFRYSCEEDMLGAMLNAIRYLRRVPEMTEKRVARARTLLAGNAVDRLLTSSPVPAMERHGVSPVANVVMPLWGRVGSSYAMEAQVRYLMGKGYFVNQVFLMDKPVNTLDAIEYFWKMLRENSVHARGSVQRIAFHPEAKAEQGRGARKYLRSGAFGQFLARIARNSCEDPAFERELKKADLTVVNHVFHSGWAFRRTGGKRILETHDIQSYQMASWPLINEETAEPDHVRDLLTAELKIVGQYDHVVNVAREEHRILSLANSKSSLVIPYLPRRSGQGRYDKVWKMAYALELHESYRYLDQFDLLIVGDSHPANRESAIWFVNEVFKPYLVPHGFSLAIVGRLSEAVHQAVGEVPYIFYLGFVDDLESVKALSRLAVLPDRRGTGISIKTLEAFASGLSFVGTSIAFRGLRERLPERLKCYDEPQAFAQAVIDALHDEAKLTELRTLARECYEAVASREQFNAAWDDILAQVFAPKSWKQRIPPRVREMAIRIQNARNGR